MSERPKLDYASSGVDYDSIDPLKAYAQNMSQNTSVNIERLGFREIPESRGESAYVFDMGDFYGAMTIEGLGTKAKILEELKNTQQHWESIAIDTVATIANDLSTVGATPAIIAPHWAAGSSNWFDNEMKWKGLVNGWCKACDEIGATYAAGETSALPGVVSENTVELSGSGFGIINPKERLLLGERIQVGDRIVLLESSGIHANGLTLARKVATKLPDGYETRLSQTKMTYGQALLQPTLLYSPVVEKALSEKIDIHYISNMTGHGWRKVMRANRDFTYRFNFIPYPQEEFQLIQKTTKLSDKEMYETFNMGAGYAAIVKPEHAKNLVACSNAVGIKAMVAGTVEAGEKQVIIEPLNISFAQHELNIR